MVIFCSIAGTCIYKNNVGKEALNEIYPDFKDDVEAIRTNAIGNYVIGVKKTTILLSL